MLSELTGLGTSVNIRLSDEDLAGITLEEIHSSAKDSSVLRALLEGCVIILNCGKIWSCWDVKSSF